MKKRSDVVLPVAAAGVMVGAVVLLGVQYGVGTLLAAAGFAALILLALGVAALGSLALVVRRRLKQLTHLPDLGRPYVTHHEDGIVTGLLHDAAGNLVLEVAAGARQTVVMDEQGAPDHVTSAGATTSRWRLPGSAGAGAEDLGRFEALRREHVPVRLVSEGVVALTGPMMTSWRLEADNGLVVQSQA